VQGTLSNHFCGMPLVVSNALDAIKNMLCCLYNSCASVLYSEVYETGTPSSLPLHLIGGGGRFLLE
jgi:hypothetical protein